MEPIPDDEIPKKKERKKKTMTPEMLEQLAIARQKALEVKKALKESDELKIEHAKEKIKKSKTKTKSQKIKEEAEKQLAEEEAEKEPIVLKEDEPIQEEEKQTGKLIDLASEEAIEKLKKEEGTGTPSPPPPLPSGEGIEVPKMELEVPVKKPKSPKKQAYLFSSDDSSSDDERVIYVKKRSKKKKEKVYNVENFRPPAGQPVNLYQRGVPPSLVDARNGASIFSNRYR